MERVIRSMRLAFYGVFYTATKLVELTQTEPVSVFDNERIGVGDIQAGFDDRSTDQNLHFTVCHGMHYITQSFFTHFAMSHSHLQIGDPPFQRAGALVNGFYPVMQVVNLSASLNFSANGIVNDGIIMLHHEGLYRVTVSRRLFNGGHIPNTGQRHIQCSGNGGSGKGQYIHTLGNFLQPLFVADTEALLFVYDQ